MNSRLSPLAPPRPVHLSPDLGYIFPLQCIGILTPIADPDSTQVPAARPSADINLSKKLDINSQALALGQFSLKKRS